MAELATAWVTIVPTLKGASKQIEDQLGGVPTKKPGEKIGKTLGENIGKNLDLMAVGQRFQDVGKSIQGVGKSISGVGSKLTNSITKPALAAGGVVAGLVTALGFKRLVGIDTARAQFKGLGLDADAVMKQVDAGVTNTSLSMAEGASMAVGILATGAVPLNDLEAAIKRVANVSAAYGVEANQAAYLLNNVLTKQKVTWGDLSQMQMNNIPVVTALAEHYGVAGDEIMKMAQNGEISIEDLNHVLDTKAGAAAESYAESWEGIRKNIVSNIGKIGAAFLEGVFPQAKDEMANFLERLRSPEWTEKAKEIGASVAQGFEIVRTKIREAIDWWQGLDDSTKKLIGKFALAAIAAGPFLKIVGSITSVIGGAIAGIGRFVSWLGMLGVGAGAAGGGISGLLGTITRIAGPIGIAVAALIHMWQSSEGFREAVMNLGTQLWELATAVGSMLGPALSTIGALFGEVASAIGDLLGPVITWLGDAIAFVMPFILGIVEGVIGNIVGIFRGLADVIIGVVNLVKAVFTGDWAAAWEAVKQIVMGAVEAVWNFIQVWIVGRVIKAVTGFASLLRGLWSGLWNGIRSLTSTVVSGIQNLISAGMNFIRSIVSNVLSAVRSTWTSVWNGIRSFFSNIWSGLRSATSSGINGVMNLVSGIRSRITGVFSSAGSWLLSAGKNIIQGLIRGITGAVRGAVDAVKNAVGSVISGAKSALGIKSPSRVFRDEVGAMIGAGLAEGIDRSAGLVDRATDRLVDVPSVPGFAAGAPVVAAGSSGGSSVDVLSRLADVLEGLPEDIRAGLLALFDDQSRRSQREGRA